MCFQPRARHALADCAFSIASCSYSLALFSWASLIRRRTSSSGTELAPPRGRRTHLPAGAETTKRGALEDIALCRPRELAPPEQGGQSLTHRNLPLPTSLQGLENSMANQFVTIGRLGRRSAGTDDPTGTTLG